MSTTEEAIDTVEAPPPEVGREDGPMIINDYTAERHRWLGDRTIDEIADEIERRRSAGTLYSEYLLQFPAWRRAAESSRTTRDSDELELLALGIHSRR